MTDYPNAGSELPSGSFLELSTFIIGLAENPDRARQFRENPEAVLAEANISEDTKNLLRMGPAEIAAHAESTVVVVLVIIVIV
jgi:hypothetical protein